MDILARSRIEAQDPELFAAIAGEERRQRENLELIASENYASRAVREAMGCVMTNKYAEGYPGKRYYGGCEWVDVAETLAIERVKQIFGADHANVQPHSGAQANMAVFMARAAARRYGARACRSRTAAISRTARRSVFPASSTTPSRTA